MTTPRDPGEYNAQNAEQANYLTARQSFASMPPEVLQQMGSLVRMYPTLGADSAIGMTMQMALTPETGDDWISQPYIKDWAMRDAVQQDKGFMDHVWGAVKTLPRTGTLVAESLWQNSIVRRGLTTGVRVNQGESLGDAYARSGDSWLGRVTREASLGNPINIGSGIFPQSNKPSDQFGYDNQVNKGLEAGNSLASSMAKADEWSINRYGTPITDDYNRVAESTLLSKTVDGKQVYSPVSLGRAAAITVFDPQTVPFQVSSAIVDISARISGLDPIDVPMKEFGLWRANKKQITPEQGADMFRQIERAKLEENAIERADLSHLETPEGIVAGRANTSGEIQIDYDSIDELVDGYFPGGGEPSRRTLGPDSPYGAAYDDLDKHTQAIHGKNYNEWLYEEYGDFGQQVIDETITHELVHRGQIDPDVVAGGRGDAFGKNLHERTEVWRGEKFDEYDALDEVRKSQTNEVADAKAAQNAAQREQSEVVSRISAEWDDADDVRRGQLLTEEARVKTAVVEADAKVLATEHNLNKTKDELDTLKKLVSLESRAEYDATYSAGLRMLAGEKVSAQARKVALREAGITNKWRPYLKPRLIEDVLTTEGGKRTIKFLADNKSAAKQRKLLNHGISGDDQWRILQAESEAEVISILAPYLGNEVRTLPKVGRRAKPGGMLESVDGTPGGVMSEMEFKGGVISRITSSVHTTGNRLGSKQMDLELNMFDIDKTLDHAEAWMKTIRATDGEVDEILNLIMAESRRTAREGPPDVDKIAGALESLFEQKLGVLLKGVKDPLKKEKLITEVMRDFNKAQLDNTKYAQDTAGNAIDEVGSKFREVWSDAEGRMTAVPDYSAVLEAQTSMTHRKLPNVRQVRQATSRTHIAQRRAIDAITDRMPNEGAAYEYLKKWRGEGLDTTWGFGFMDKAHRVWRDLALLRLGWALRVLPEEMVRQAADGYSMAFTHPIAYLGLMTRHKLANSIVGDDFKSLIGLDDVGAGAFRDPSGAFDASRQSWTSVRRPAPDASIEEVLAWKRGLASEFLQLSADPIARKTADVGIEETMVWLQSKEGKAAARAAKLDELATPQGQRLYVERVAAMQAQMTGGRWIRKNSAGDWVDMTGAKVTDWSDMTREMIVGRINGARSARGLPPLTAKPSSYPKGHWVDMAVQETGIPVLRDYDGTYVVTQAGDSDMKNVFAHGTDQHGQRIQYDEMKLTSDHDWDIDDFSNRLSEMYDELGVELPQNVRVPRNALDRNREVYDSSVDAIFQSLMAKPSAGLNRNPYFKQKYAEDMARTYLFADADLRRHLLKWADDENYMREFRKAIKEQANEAGLQKIPQPGRTGKAFGMKDMEDIDVLARQRALRDTKDLFYDLAERNNITDMLKFVFPFADAWYEVLSRWAGLMFTNAQRAPTNWRRAQVGIMNARKSGFFQEDEYGNETFMWPGAGLLADYMMNTPENVRTGTAMSLDKLMFIDPDPRGLLAPGVGPFIQFPAAMATPVLEQFPEVQNAVNWFAFGDFEKGKPASFGEAAQMWLPSYARQVIDAWHSDDMRNEFADEIGARYDMLIQSKGRGYETRSAIEDKAIQEEARTFGTVLSWLKIVDRFAAPATPTYESELLIEGPDKEFWITSAALSSELAAAKEFFGDPDAANNYFYDTFGVNPLNVGSDTYRVSDAPMTETPYEWLRANQEMYDIAPNSMMAWLTVPEDEDFFAPARTTAIQEGQVVRTTVEQRAFATSERNGWAAWKKVQEDVEELEAHIKMTTEPRTDRRTRQMEVVREWKAQQRNRIFEDHWGWDNQQNRTNVGLAQKAKPTDIWDELIQQGIPGTPQYNFTREIDPAMSDWVVEFSTTAQVLFEAGMSEGDRNWWITSTSDNAEAIRAGWIDNLQIKAVGSEPETMARIEYVLDRYIEPVMEGWAFDEELWLSPEPPKDYGEPTWADPGDGDSIAPITFKADKKQQASAGVFLP